MSDATLSEPSRAFIARDLVTLLIVSALYRLIFLVVLRPVVDTADAIHYLAMARDFAHGAFAGFDTNLPVLYPLLGAAFTALAGDVEWGCRLVSLLASTLLVVPLYLLARDLHGRAAAFLAALLAALWPWLADYGCRIGPEALAVTLWFLGVWLMARAVRRGGTAAFLAPLAFFALYLTRPEGAILMIAAPILALLLTYRAPNASLTRLIPYIVILGILVVMTLIVMRSAADRAAVIYRAPGSGDFWDYLMRGRVPFVKTWLAIVGDALPVMLGPVLLVFAGAGFFTTANRARDARLELFLLAFCAVQIGVTLLNFSPAPRYLMPVVIAVSIWSSRGLILVTRQAATLPRGRLLRVLPIGVTLLLMLQGTVVTLGAEFTGRVPRQPREYKVAGQWMRDNTEPGIILTRKPQIGFYAHMPTTGPAATDTPGTLLDRAKESGARYLVIDERYTAQDIPALAALLDPANAPRFLRPLRDDLSPYPDARIIIYEIADPSLEYTDPASYGGPRSYAGPETNR